MQKSQEMVDIIGEEIKEVLQNNIGSNNSPETCNIIKTRITNYLTSIQDKLSFSKIPVVKVENQGPFVTVNFFDNQDNRLESLDDMIDYMNGVVL